MSEDRRQILEMLSQGKITADEAERLLKAMGEGLKAEPSGTRTPAKFLRIIVESDESHLGHGCHGSSGPTKVNIRVPMQLLRAGVKLASLIPKQARAHVNEELRKYGMDVDLSQLKPENLEELIDHINELTVDVDDRSNKVKIFCE